MSVEANKAIFKRFYEQAWNAGDLGVVDQLLAIDFVNHEISGTTASHRELYKQAVVETRAAFPDWTTTIDDVIAEGDKVVARWQGQGTRATEVSGIDPTGNQIRTTGITIVRVAGGKITDFWKKDDSYSVWQQFQGVSQGSK